MIEDKKEGREPVRDPDPMEGTFDPCRIIGITEQVVFEPSLSLDQTLLRGELINPNLLYEQMC
jgi:hypothetical protein